VDGSQGVTGPQGFTGPRGSDANTTYVTTFSTASVITVTHSFGGYPIVQAIDDAGFKITSSSYSIYYGSTNSYTITFDTALSGSILTGGGVSGPQGITGPQGTQGVQGPIGPTGLGGANGAYLIAYDTSNQINAGTTASNITRFNSLTGANAISVSGGTVSFSSSGTYNIDFTGSFQKGTVTENRVVYVWLRKNGSNLTYTRKEVLIDSDYTQSYNFDWMMNLVPDDKIEIFWSSGDATMKLQSGVTQSGPLDFPDRPSRASAVLQIQQVMYLQTGPTGVQGPTGSQGNSITWNGDYSDTFTYSLNDVVYYQGTSYISLTTSNYGVYPNSTTSSWNTLALKGEAGSNSQTNANYGDGLGYLINWDYFGGLVGIPGEPGEIVIRVATPTMSIGTTQTFLFYGIDYDLVDRYEFFYPILTTNNGIRKNTLRLTGDITNDFRVESISYTSPYWTVNTTVVSGTSTLGGLINNVGVSYIPTNSPTGSMVITSNVVPTYSGAIGQFGETRLGLSGSTPYLYVYTDQWYRFMGETF